MLFDIFKKKSKIIQPDVNNLFVDCFNIKVQIDHNNDLMIVADFNDKANIAASSEALYMLANGELLAYILESFLKNSDKLKINVLIYFKIKQKKKKNKLFAIVLLTDLKRSFELNTP